MGEKARYGRYNFAELKNIDRHIFKSAYSEYIIAQWSVGKERSNQEHCYKYVDAQAWPNSGKPQNTKFNRVVLAIEALRDQKTAGQEKGVHCQTAGTLDAYKTGYEVDITLRILYSIGVSKYYRQRGYQTNQIKVIGASLKNGRKCFRQILTL